MLVKQNTSWSGQKDIIGNRGLPQSIADFDPSLLGMTLTDSVKRDADGQLNRAGKSTNLTNRMITLVNKLFNIRQPVTPRQALNVEPSPDGYNGWHDTKTSAQAKELAQQLGLTQQ